MARRLPRTLPAVHCGRPMVAGAAGRHAEGGDGSDIGRPQRPACSAHSPGVQ